MAGHVRTVSEEYHPLTIGRNVRKPVIEIVGENLLLLAAIGLHAPDLHMSGAFGVEVDVVAVRRVFGAVIQAFGRGQARLFAARYGDRVNIKVAIALADKGERLAVGRPTSPGRRRT